MLEFRLVNLGRTNHSLLSRRSLGEVGGERLPLSLTATSLPSTGLSAVVLFERRGSGLDSVASVHGTRSAFGPTRL